MITTGNIQKCTPRLQVIMQSTKCQLAIIWCPCTLQFRQRLRPEKRHYYR
ncbi:hypothetical protein THERMOT_2005 [Bathymodiolus thermophilus thioautotrophic gill symbiont]|nr:hypothetical protein THERMOT_2005 [Bathymodiolus thermophilus thioautotrophic gill symbiont]